MIGTTVSRYRILSKLGGGGMGVVYEAEDTELGRRVAIKFLPDGTASSGDALERFKREARAASALDHPHICVVFDVGTHEGQPFLVMERLRGQTLKHVIGSRRMPVDEVVRLGEQYADALDAAHHAGIVHRDLKPANLFVTERGDAKILDFGLAKVGTATTAGAIDAAAPTVAGEFLTEAGTTLGTVAYMSPEQAKGQVVDARSDLFSLGVVLYEMATGRLPFRGESSAELFAALLRSDPAPPRELDPDVPPKLEDAILKALDKDPSLRYQTAADLRGDLRRLLRESSGAARSDSSSRRRDERLSSKGKDAASSRRGLWIGVGAASVAVLGVASWLAIRGASFGEREGGAGGPAPTIRSIAVLPLDNYSGDPAQDYFAEGMTDELTTDLAHISQLRVISRGSAMQFQGKNRPPAPEIARRLDVDAVVEGSVVRSGERVRITAQLIDARADRHLWAKSFESSTSDVLTLQDELARAIANEIHVQITPARRTRPGRTGSVRPDAYDAYLKGRYFFNRPSDENLQKAIARFEEAIALDAGFAPALSGLSDAYLWAGFNEGFLTASEARPKAKAAAERAIALDDSSAEAHTSLAVFKTFYEYDWAGAEAEFRRAIELNPSYAFAHDQFALGLAFQSRFDESVAESRRAAELDPLNPQIPIDAYFALVWSGDLDAARGLVNRSSDLDPTYFMASYSDGWLDIQTGNLRDAIRSFEKAKAMGAPPFVSAYLAYAYGASGDGVRAQAEIEETKRLSLHGSITPFNLAVIAMGQGDHGRAVSYLEQAYASDSQWLGWLSGDRIFDPLRNDPRFVALLKKIGLAG